MKTRILFLFAAIASVQIVHAATWTVTNTNDSGAGSLRQALADAVDGDAIDFNLTYPATITLTSDQLTVDKNVTINGPGAANLAISGNNAWRVFLVNPFNAGAAVTIDGLTITGGHASDSGGGICNVGATLTVTNSTISGNTATAGSGGGGIFNAFATLTVTNSTISNNTIESASDTGGGGGIRNFDGTLTVTNSTIDGNLAGGGNGGGIANEGDFNGPATLTVTNSTISGNTATAGSGGGGIRNNAVKGSANTLTVTNSTISGNTATAGSGGGIGNDGSFSGSATLTVTNSTISGNISGIVGCCGVISGAGGGGIGNDGSFSGSATLTVTNSTISGNTAIQGISDGGGILNHSISGSATLTVTNSTISGNVCSDFGCGIASVGSLSGSAMTTVFNSTFSNGCLDIGISGATLEIGGTILQVGLNFPGSTVVSDGYNLTSGPAQGDGTTGPGGYLNATGDIRNTDPMLGPLQDNGGSTFTQALLPTSPAIDAGNPNFTPPPDYDQRGPGYPRVANARIDIGAFEVQASPTPTPTPAYAAQVQQPINADGTSVFNVKRGVVPVKFTLTLNGAATCALPPATITLTRTGGGTTGPIDESIYTGPADNGSNFRIDSCQYIYNLSASALGVGTYRMDITIGSQVVGNAVFQLK